MSMRSVFILSLSVLMISGCISKKGEDINYCDYVDPFVGTTYTGHTYPGAAYPFGMMQPGPQTGNFEWDYCAGYRYEDEKIWGFTQNRLNGTGVPDMGDLLMMPFSGKPADAFQSRYDKKSEKATPGYYRVKLTDHKVRIELTATPHVAMHKYFFEGEEGSVYIDFQSGSVGSRKDYDNRVVFSDVRIKNDSTIVGHQIVRAWTRRQLFFVMKFDRPFVSVKDVTEEKDSKAPKKVFCFDTGKEELLQVKIAYSMVNLEGAERNMEAELDHWNFEKVKDNADKEWNRYLSRVKVEGTEDQKKNFYTSVYH